MSAFNFILPIPFLPFTYIALMFNHRFGCGDQLQAECSRAQVVVKHVSTAVEMESTIDVFCARGVGEIEDVVPGGSLATSRDCSAAVPVWQV